MIRLFVFAFLLIWLSACTLIPPMPPSGEAPFDAGPVQTGPDAQAGDEWWARFASPDLEGLLTRARAGNQELAQGSANLAAALAALREADAAMMPQLGAGLSAGSDSRDGLSDIDWTARISASYQPDLSGLDRAGRRAARARADLVSASRRALDLTVSAQTASGWFSLLAAREQLRVARENLVISERIHAIVEVRYRGGLISGFDLASQSASLASVKARIPQIEARINSLETALALLLAETPGDYNAPQADILDLHVPMPAAGMAAPVLLRRPDVMQAEAALRVADADIDAARAAFLPEIDLGAGLSLLLASGADPLASLSGSVSGILFAGGRLDARLAGARARREGEVAAYRQTILVALREIDVGLQDVRASAQREGDLVTAREAAGEALRLAEIRYRAGADDLTSLLAAQKTYFDAADAAVSARLDRLNAAVSLYAALAGGY